ncbi:MAG: hypothetical protein R2713_22645 [Ilumatobacteraceae bacterium]
MRWNASYLTGFTSEKRDQDVAHTAAPELERQLFCRSLPLQVESEHLGYDRGVRWERERLQVHGLRRWVAMYLPVWLYSYYHEKNGTSMVHYIAVNGRTGEVMGSVPVSTPRLVAAALTVGTVIENIVIAILGPWDERALLASGLVAASSDSGPVWCSSSGPPVPPASTSGLWQYYRNTGKSHSFERETRVEAKPIWAPTAR